METWAEIRARHRREKLELLQTLAQSSFSYRSASEILETPEENVRSLARHYKVIFQTHKSNERKVRYHDESNA